MLGAIMAPYIDVVAPRMQVLDNQQGFRHYFCPRLEECQPRRYSSYPSPSSDQEVTLLLSRRVLHQPPEVMYVGGAESMGDDIFQFDEMTKDWRWEGVGGETSLYEGKGARVVQPEGWREGVESKLAA